MSQARHSRWLWMIGGPSLAILIAGCGSRQSSDRVAVAEEEEPPALLSAYGFFEGNGATQHPTSGTVTYDVNTPLFSDYATKYRFAHVPPGTAAAYHPTEAFDFPVGTTLIKTFAYLHDMRDPSKGRRLVETRLLIRKPKGWVGLPYVWNDEQTEATLRIIGATREISWTHSDGIQRQTRYNVPNMNQCLGCHENKLVMRPIGLTARSLNRSFDYGQGPENQLRHWTSAGILTGAPGPDQAPRMAVWNNPATGTLDQRARAWLEMNCAHCHNPAGPARVSGLDLRAGQIDLSRAGVWKSPVAAGRGSGGRWYDIIPNKPNDSIVPFRIASTEPGVMMPELGRRLVDEDGLALIRSWIAAMPDPRKQ